MIFTLPADIVGDAEAGLLLGEFNNWDYNNAINLKKQKDGSMKATATLESGKTYEYRYLLNDGRWVNDQKADTYVHISGYYVENCVINVPAPSEAKPKKSKNTPEKATNNSSEPDDLTKIEGIGKKIAALLVAEKIETFKDLSKTSVKKLKSILAAAGNKLKLHDPSTWPQQAKLAQAGNWTELDEFQKKLVGGK